MKTCANCRKLLNPFKAFITSRTFPVNCDGCGSMNFRNHSIFYYTANILFSAGILVLIFLAISQGFGFAMKFFIGFLLLLIGIYFLEFLFRPLEVYTNEEKQKDQSIGYKKAMFVLAVILISIALYFWG